ncbi:phosphate/phosphite/phosphonate ABC transporter substrate-binding protein [Lacimonas salitolerans]|uniref:Phosphate/phosphite/phosphonate ABC transporter substrate-binding protein n=1 Tax=Lacimonas salitolerans TaxID=1323750 RepID=A0ABW4EK43_9RHOB
MNRTAYLASAIVLASFAAAPSFAQEDWRETYSTLTFGLSTGENQQSAAQRWGAMAPYLAECLGIEEVVVRIGNDYSAIIESMVQGDVQLAWYGPAQYAIVHDLLDGDVVPVAMDVSPQNDLGYKWVIAVKADSPYQTLEDLKGKTLGWGTPTSTSGYVLPMQHFREIGYVNEANEPIHFGALVQTGSHDNGLVSVVQGTIDATTNWYYSPAAGSHTRAAGNGLIKLEDIRFIHESPMAPNAPFTTRKSYPDDMKAKMSECFINMRYSAPEVYEVVTKDVFGGFALVQPEAYDPFVAIRQAEKRQ